MNTMITKSGATNQIPCVGGVVVHEGKLLIVRRANEPGAGRWSIPGGRVEPGETHSQACVREVYEETGVEVMAGRILGSVERPSPSGGTYSIDDFSCVLVGPAQLTAGDDADEARWVTLSELESLPTVDGLLTELKSWYVFDSMV